MIKQVIVVRKDLNMRKGKMCAQAAHASLGAVFSKSFVDPTNETEKSVGISNWKVIPLTTELETWFNDKFTKICVGCDSEEELVALYEEARRRGLIHFLCTDAGRTEFHGVPTKTTLAIGPADEDVIDQITGHLKLL